VRIRPDAQACADARRARMVSLIFGFILSIIQAIFGLVSGILHAVL
jgi:hypothetical protein